MRPDSESTAAPSPSPLVCAEGMALVDASALRFCIDRWEGSLVLVTSEGDAPFSPYDTVGDRRVRAVSRAGVVPQGYVSQLDAKAACEASRKRLCQAPEWLRACKGPSNTTFPYGQARRDGFCNGESVVAPLAFMPPWQRFPNMTNMNNPLLNQLKDTVAPTGQFSRCTNEYGVFDMVGNLHEWVASGASGAAFRGGYYRDTSQNGDGCDYETTAHPDWYHDYSTGFRCCADASVEPDSR